MRTLPAPLLAAQKSASTEPRVEVTAENSIAALRRLDFTLLDNTPQTIAKHDAAVAGDGSVTRVRSDNAGNIYVQRVANPGAGPWNTWTLFTPPGKGATVACVAFGARVVIVYTDGAGTGIKLRESTDYGVSYGAETAVVTAAAAVVDLSAAYKNSSGDLAIAWATAATLNIIKRTSGVFAAASQAGSTFSSLNGVAVCFGADYDIALTGVEVTTLRRTLWTIIYGDGVDAPLNTWGTLYVQQQAEADSNVAYSAPFAAYFDAFRINYVEADAFTGGTTRVYRTALHPLNTWVIGANMFSTPVPVNYTGAEGLALAADANAAGYVYESAPDSVYRAPQPQIRTALTAGILAAEIHERDGATSGFIDLDNSAGAYSGPPAPIDTGNRLDVRWGYNTASGYQSSKMADLWIAAYEYRRAGGMSVLRLHVEGGWEMLRRNRQRTQIVHAATDSYYSVLLRIMSRAGLRLSGAGVSSRADSVAPKSTIHADMSGFDAARQALAYVADRIRMTTIAGCVMLEPLAADASTYSYGAAHPLRELTLRTEPSPVSEAQAFGAGAFGEAIDFASAGHGAGTREQQRDITSATGAAAAATAAAHLRRRALDAAAGRIVVPPNCGQELFDVIDVGDPLIAPTAVKRRVAGIRWRYDARRGIYEQELHLGPV